MEIDVELLACYCDEAMDSLNKWESVCLELLKREDVELIKEVFRIAHNLKGGSRSVGLLAYGDFVHHIEDGITLLCVGKLSLSAERITLLLDVQRVLAEWTIGLRTDSRFAPDTSEVLRRANTTFSIDASLASHSAVIGSAEVQIPVVEMSATLQAESSPEHQSTSHKDNAVVATSTGGSSRGNSGASSAKKNATNNETIRISAQKLDQLIQVIGELSIHQSIVWHTRGESLNANKVFMKSAQMGQKLTKELYDKALSLRMQPIQSVFQRLERNILELASTLEKDVNVEILGGDVELDKSVIEKIVDPLTHIVRNAVDHGIEATETRENNGKPRRGNIQISASQDVYGVILVIKDDGKGLAADRIRRKAIEKGMIGEATQLKQREIFDLIMQPGFSTAEKITDLSGRGVGMDVVKQALTDLQGSIQIQSDEGLGTTFTITLPTSVSIIDVILIQVAGQKIVVPVSALDEVLELDTPMEISAKMLHHNDHVIGVQDLENILFSKSKSVKNTGRRNTVMICSHNKMQMGFFIERVVGQQQVVIRPLSENINGAFGLMGGAILGDGEPGLIIDVPALISKFSKETQAAEMAS